MDQVIQIITATTRQTQEPPEGQRGMIERALKLGAKLMMVSATQRQRTYG